VIDYILLWHDKTGIAASRMVGWLGICQSKYNNWRHRYGRANEHNCMIPRDHWLTDGEKREILNFWNDHQQEGYRRITYMLIDQDIVAASPSSVYRVLHKAGVLTRATYAPTKKGTGFEQPLHVHEHWHIDISYLNLCGTFYYLCSVLDGASRYITHWDIKESMTETEVEMIIERARAHYPGVTPRMISDNGPQFIARDFKEYIRLVGMTHVRTSPYYPQSNGKIERWHKTLKTEAIRPQTPLCLSDARRVVAKFVKHYNEVRLHSAIGYVTPKDAMEGRAEEIQSLRCERLEAARIKRAERHHDIHCVFPVNESTLSYSLAGG
jgi:transposase InsO family protein